MISLRKFSALVTVVALLLTLWAPVAVSAEPVAQQDDLLYFGRSILAQMDNGDALCYAYDQLVYGIAEHQKKIDISHRTHTISWDEAPTVYHMVMADHPEFFYIDRISYGGWNNVTHFSPVYFTEVESYASLVFHRAQVLIEGLEDKSDYEKSLILHDRLCDAVTYNIYSNYNQTVVSSLALGQSVCAGYTRAYQMMLQMLGIPCYFVTGMADNGSGVIEHAWNLVLLDGEWYYSDVTWDDQNDNGSDNIFYTYFNTTYDQMAVNHYATDYAEYLPHSTATKNNLYVRNNLVVKPNEEPDLDKIAQGFKNVYPFQIYYTGDTTEGAYWLFSHVGDIAKKMLGNNVNYNSPTSVPTAGHSIIVDLTLNHTHTFEISTVPACGHAPGTITEHCTTCGYSKKRTLDPVGHEMEWEWNETHHVAHCHHCGIVENEGEHVFEGSACVYCGYTLEVHEHTYDAVVTYPDCINGGYTTYTCTGCGDSYVGDETDALGHHYDTIITDPTCNQEGQTVYICTTCGDSYSEPIPATGEHIYDAVVTPPDCVNGGYTTYTCTICGDSYSEPIPATGEHTYDTVVTPPDCVNGGYTTYTCTVCGDSYVGDETDALGHHYDAIITDPTCNQEGQTVYICTTCGDSYSEPIPATGEHTYDAVVTPPDCVNGGYTTYTCTVCGDSYVSDEVDALGHVYDTDCDADCNVCGAIRDVVGHVYDDEYDADCNVCGAIREVPEKPVDILYGDLNDDGNINNRDLALLQQYLNGWSVTVNETASDVNADGNINNRDLALLQQYLNGWSVTLG